MMPLTTETVFSILSQIPDPEIPVISIVELGVIRHVAITGDASVDIKITPTYSGCPAMSQIEKDILAALKEKNIEVTITTIYNPPWTTDWIPEEAKEKLRVYGIAPPEQTSSDTSWLTGKSKTVSCPRCRSVNTELKSLFGSTACKALYQCKDCLEPFDYFKCI